jgi:hypothetical protein
MSKVYFYPGRGLTRFNKFGDRVTVPVAGAGFNSSPNRTGFKPVTRGEPVEPVQSFSDALADIVAGIKAARGSK